MYSVAFTQRFVRIISSGLVALSVLVVGISPLSALPARAAVSNWQKGMSIYPTYSEDFSTQDFKNLVDHLKSLGFNYITLVLPYYQSNTGSTDIQAGGNTPSDAALAAGIQYAHQDGMKVMIKIHLDTYDGQWRAYINPSDRATWFKNYGAMLTHVGTIAQQNGAEEFTIGTELIDMSTATSNPGNTAAWQSLIGQVRQVFKGSVLYDANWGGDYFTQEAAHVGFWGSLDYIGISAYYNLNTDDSVASLEHAWNDWNNSDIKPLATQYNKPILFSEIGYRSVTNAHLEPWNSGSGGSYDPQEQVNDYTALFQYWNDYSYMQGVQLWYQMTPSWAGGAGNTDYFTNGKPAEATISQWFSSSQTGGGGTMGTPAFTAAGSASGGTLTANITDTGAASAGTIVDLEVYQGSSRVFQQFFEGQDFAAGQARTYTANWTPGGSGTYAFKIGVFNSNWSTNYVWNDSAATISGSGGGSQQQTINIWWPTNGATIGGTQPLKAMVTNLDVSQYRMYWQVDGGSQNEMANNSTDYPHKESSVDVSGWGAGAHTLTFIARDNSGNQIAAQSVSVNVQ